VGLAVTEGVALGTSGLVVSTRSEVTSAGCGLGDYVKATGRAAGISGWHVPQDADRHGNNGEMGDRLTLKRPAPFPASP
jgi:hypothetical protein